MNEPAFNILCRAFLFRIVDLEALSPDGDVSKLLGQFSALFAAVSIAFTAPLIFISGLPEEMLWTMQHLLISTTMITAGCVSLVCWDSLFPDKRDVLILLPLPIPPRTILLAKITALLVIVTLSLVSLNILTGVIWPFLFQPPDSGAAGALRSLAAYAATTGMAGAFMFSIVFGAQAIATLVLPRQIFLRLSVPLQVCGYLLFIGVYFLEPSLESRAALASSTNQGLLGLLPTYWFLGLFQELNGAMQPIFAPLARRAWLSLGAVFGVIAVFLPLAYSNALRRITEQPDLVRASRPSFRFLPFHS